MRRHVLHFWVLVFTQANVVTGEGIQECFLEPDTAPDVVINCVALSQPAACERDPELARLVNVPHKLLAALKLHKERTSHCPLLIHISTDQIYDGSKAHWKEDDVTAPINVYGQTKLEAEQEIGREWPHHVVLRSSIIYGPPPPGAPVNRGLFLQFIKRSIESKQMTEFFADEWRCPIYVKDIVAVCQAFIQSHSRTLKDHEAAPKIFNMGGPQRMSRVDMAMAVAKVCSLDPSYINAVPASTVPRGVPSPADISMDSSLLENTINTKFTIFSDALTAIFSVETS
jgi:dTDP-4-dehydrorhamnose reductase